jgi:hypothetical protein
MLSPTHSSTLLLHTGSPWGLRATLVELSIIVHVSYLADKGCSMAHIFDMCLWPPVIDIVSPWQQLHWWQRQGKRARR